MFIQNLHLPNDWEIVPILEYVPLTLGKYTSVFWILHGEMKLFKFLRLYNKNQLLYNPSHLYIDNIFV